MAQTDTQLHAHSKLDHVTHLIEDEITSAYGPPPGGDAAAAALRHRIADILRAAGDFAEGETESRHVTILLSDIRGFAAIAETYPALRVVAMLNRYFARMCEVVVQYGGTIDKFMGDSIMVLFGAPSSEPDDVERAVACAVQMQLAMGEINEQNLALGLPEIFMGIGINSGSVVAGPLGSELHSEYTVIGDEVNLTSRIESHSLRGQILISENTYALAKSFIEVGAPNIVQVKGKRQPVKLYELLSTEKPHNLVVPRRDERKSLRVSVNMPLEFQRLDGKQILDKKFRGDVIDISYNGIMTRVPMELAPLSEIKLALSLQFLGSETSDAYAKVLRCEPWEDAYRCHMEFTSMDQQGRQAVKQFVDGMI